MTTKRIGLASLFAVGAIALLSSAAIAQPPGGMPPGMMEKIKAMQKYFKDHAKVVELSESVYKIEKLNEDDDQKLDKKQSATMLAIMNANKSKMALSEDEASTLNKKVTGLMTQKQTKKLVTIPIPWKQNRGGGGASRMGGGAGKMGGGPPGGFKMPEMPKSGYNPFNPDSLPDMMKERSKKSLEDFKAALTKQAH